MPSAIDPTHPAPGAAVSKAASRANWAAAKAELEHGGFVTNPTTGNEATGQAALANVHTALVPKVTSSSAITIVVDAALFAGALVLVLLCTSGSAVTVTLAADIPVGRMVRLRQQGAGTVTAQAGAGATVTKTTVASLATTEQYDNLILVVDTNEGGTAAAWSLI